MSFHSWDPGSTLGYFLRNPFSSLIFVKRVWLLFESMGNNQGWCSGISRVFDLFTLNNPFRGCYIWCSVSWRPLTPSMLTILLLSGFSSTFDYFSTFLFSYWTEDPGNYAIDGSELSLLFFANVGGLFENPIS